ncbi:hypothetical protein GCM10010246_16230 [Streptomyces cuspidosporus]|uniref:Major facilitator superfamily (MFS) profile domain-containing protein n=1 Tax=Streptomyces cuspidosporus TaxID=66882 RepID=A0ABN3FM86_9ACTN
MAMLNVALPSIRADLGMSTGELQWVMSAYVVGYGGFMLLGGRAADLFGRRRMFLFWLTVFLLFSGLGGFADDGPTLIVARFVTGVAAAFMTPAGLSIVTTSFEEGPQRDKALLVYSGTAAGGFSVGLVVGGLLTSADWRWVFYAPVVLSFLVLAAPRSSARSACAAVPATGRRRHDAEGRLLLRHRARVLPVHQRHRVRDHDHRRQEEPPPGPRAPPRLRSSTAAPSAGWPPTRRP